MPPVDARNLFAAIPEAVPGQAEFVERLAGANGARVERIVSRGHASPPGFWYDQAETEWVLLVAGRARLRFDPERVLELGPGDHVVIAPHARHRVEWTDPAVATVWIAVFLPAEPA
jgi:cupin 2 domain-containing protein